MNLKDFIRETIVEIVQGVNLAKVDVKDYAAVAPNRIEGEITRETTYLNFDIAVTVSSKEAHTSAGGGKIGGTINVVAAKFTGEVGANGQKEVSESQENISRIQFKVPVNLSVHYRNDSLFAAEADLIKKLEDA